MVILETLALNGAEQVELDGALTCVRLNGARGTTWRMHWQEGSHRELDAGHDAGT